MKKNIQRRFDGFSSRSNGFVGFDRFVYRNACPLPRTLASNSSNIFLHQTLNQWFQIYDFNQTTTCIYTTGVGLSVNRRHWSCGEACWLEEQRNAQTWTKSFCLWKKARDVVHRRQVRQLKHFHWLAMVRISADQMVLIKSNMFSKLARKTDTLWPSVSWNSLDNWNLLPNMVIPQTVQTLCDKNFKTVFTDNICISEAPQLCGVVFCLAFVPSMPWDGTKEEEETKKWQTRGPWRFDDPTPQKHKQPVFSRATFDGWTKNK